MKSERDKRQGKGTSERDKGQGILSVLCDFAVKPETRNNEDV